MYFQRTDCIHYLIEKIVNQLNLVADFGTSENSQEWSLWLLESPAREG